MAALGLFDDEGSVELEPRIDSTALLDGGESQDNDSDAEVETEADCPEDAVIFLPSQMKRAERERCGLVDMGHQEAALRIGQMNDALHSLRMVLGEKSLMLRTSVCNAQSQRQITRAWGNVNRLEAQVQQYCKVYEQAQQALSSLEELDPHYQEITRGDLKMPGDITEENRTGQRSDSLAWFWRLAADVNKSEGSHLEGTSQMQECVYHLDILAYTSSNSFLVYRVNWLRASARFQRWHEEVVLLKHEMVWTVNYFKKQKEIWKLRWQHVDIAGLEGAGLQSYAAKQAAMWDSLASQAKEIFNTCQTVET